MFELFQSILTIFLITINCYFPKKYCSNFNILGKSEQNFINQLSIGTIIHIFSLLILSFLTLLSNKIIFYYFGILFTHNLFFILREKINTSDLKLEVFFLYFTIFIIVIFFLNNFIIGWDAQNYWVTKALTIFNDNSIENLKYTTRPEYPHLGAFIWSFYAKFSLINNELYGRIFYIYFFCLSLISISKILSKNKLHNLIFYSFLILICFKNSLFNGYQEVLIFSLFILITKEFYLFLDKKNNNNLGGFLVIILSCLSMSWIKSEGMIFALLFLCIYIFSLKSNLKRQLIASFSLIIIIALKLIYSNLIDLNSSFQSGNYEFFNIENFTDYVKFERILLIVKYFILGIFQNLIFLLSILAGLLLIKDRKEINILKYYLLFLIFCASFIFCAYIFTNLPLEFHLKYSVDRLFFQISGFFIICLIMVYKKLYKKVS